MRVSRIKVRFQINHSLNQGSVGRARARTITEGHVPFHNPCFERSIADKTIGMKTIKSEEELKRTFFDKVWPGQMEYYYQ